MTTLKNHLPRASPLPCLTPVPGNTSLKSALSSMQPILPDIVSSTISQKRRTKKRVRFALKLEDADEDSPVPSDHENDVVLTTKSNKRFIDPWREDGPLYGAYVEYLETKDSLTPEIIETNQSLTPEPDNHSRTYTHTFLIHSKSPEMVMDSIRVSTPSRHLPRLLHRIKPNKKTNRKSLSPVIDPYLKQRKNSSTPPRYSQSKKLPNSFNNKNQVNSKYSVVKRTDIVLPAIKHLNSHEKVIRSDRRIETNIVNEYLHTKTLTEVITNPLPGTNNQINHISGHSILSNLSKTGQTSYQNQLNSMSYVFQNHNNDQFQHIIHSAH